MTRAKRPATPPSQTSEARAARGKRQRLVRLDAPLDERYQAVLDRGYTGAEVLEAGIKAYEEHNR